MFLPMSVTVVTGTVDWGLGLAEPLADGWIAGKPVSFCFEHAVPTEARARIRASAVNVRRMWFPLQDAATTARSVVVLTTAETRANRPRFRVKWLPVEHPDGSLKRMDERERDLHEAVERSGEMMLMVLGQEIPDPDLVGKQTVWDFDHHFTPGLVKYRKSVTEAGDFAALEWTGEGSIVRDLLGREWIDCLGGYGIYDLGIRNPEVAAVRAQLDRNPM